MFKRRRFLHTALTASTTLFLPEITIANSVLRNPEKKVLPKRIKRGSRIGLIAPGYAIKPEVLDEAIKALKSMGLRPIYTHRIIGNEYGYFSNTDEERANDLNEMFANKKVDAILCARGGYGCTRLLDKIDYAQITKTPKALIGFSDVTALLNAIEKRTGLVTFHGPVGSTLNDPYSIAQLEKIIMYPSTSTKIENIERLEKQLLTNAEYDRYTIFDGISTGKLVGGSLTLINALIGTPHEIDFTDALVCIEDVEEAPYRIDRMLTQLIDGKTFTKSAGIIFGVCAGCNESTNSNSFTLKEVLMDRIGPLGIPAVYGMSFGHVKNNFTFPIGTKAELDTFKMQLTLLERAVR